MKYPECFGCVQSRWVGRILLTGLLCFTTQVLAEEYYPTDLQAPSAELVRWAQEKIIQVDPESILSRVPRAGLPSRVVNIKYLPKVGRQRWGACSAWSSTYYYKTWQEAKEHGWERPDPAVDPEHIMSPFYLLAIAPLMTLTTSSVTLTG